MSVSKHDLIKWADERREVDLVSKTILKSLAFFAEDDGDTWRPVAKLADDANCSERTVQYRMRWLVEHGYVKDTGRQRRLKHSTRTVPIYLLAPSFEDEYQACEQQHSMGANSAPIPDAWVQNPTGMGATVCTPNETQESLEVSDETSPRAREGLEEAYRRVEAAYPRIGLSFTDPKAARVALADVLGQGVAVADLVTAAADPRLVKDRKFPPVGLHRWLGEGRYRGTLPERGAAVAAPAGVWPGPPELFADLETMDPAASACLLRAGWDEDERRVIAATSWAADRLSRHAPLFEKHRCTLAPWSLPT